MQCPKCNEQMSHQQRVFSRESTIDGQYGEASFTSGMSCWNCGKWIDDPFKQAMPFPGKYQRIKVERRITATDRIIMANRALVLNLCAAGESSAQIARILQFGNAHARCRANAVQVSISRLQLGVLDGLQQREDATASTTE